MVPPGHCETVLPAIWQENQAIKPPDQATDQPAWQHPNHSTHGPSDSIGSGPRARLDRDFAPSMALFPAHGPFHNQGYSGWWTSKGFRWIQPCPGSKDGETTTVNGNFEALLLQ